MRRQKSAFVEAWKADLVLNNTMLTVVVHSQYQQTAVAEEWLIIRVKAQLEAVAWAALSLGLRTTRLEWVQIWAVDTVQAWALAWEQEVVQEWDREWDQEWDLAWDLVWDLVDQEAWVEELDQALGQAWDLLDQEWAAEPDLAVNLAWDLAGQVVWEAEVVQVWDLRWVLEWVLEWDQEWDPVKIGEQGPQEAVLVLECNEWLDFLLKIFWNMGLGPHLRSRAQEDLILLTSNELDIG